MMNVTRVFVERDYSPRFVEARDRFKYRKEKGWRRLQKVCFWVLRKIGAYDLVEVDPVRTVKRFDYLSIWERIHEPYCELRSRGVSPKTLYMGPSSHKEFIDFMHSEVFTLDFSACRTGRNEFMGMEIVFVPWMDGELLV